MNNRINLKDLKIKILELIILSGILIGNPSQLYAPIPPKLKNNLENVIVKSPKKQELISHKDARMYVKRVIKKINPPKPINEDYIMKVIKIESSFDIYAESEAGARGLMQIMPKTWIDLEKKLSFEEFAYNPFVNIKVGIIEKTRLIKLFKREYSNWKNLTEQEQLKLIAAASNAGYNKLKKHDWKIDLTPNETRNHIKKIFKEF